MAWDAGAGALLVAVDGADPKLLFPNGLKPGRDVGAGLFPALSGSQGCRVSFNLGQRPFRHGPPAGFLPCSSAAPAALEQVCVMPARALRHGVWRRFSAIFLYRMRVCAVAQGLTVAGPQGAEGLQGAGTEELLEAFDAVGSEHEKMETEKFNDDGTYKAGINQVGVV